MQEPAERLVSLRPDVLNEAEHAVGNFLQRIHHMARLLASAADDQQGERLRAALSDLERVLELLFDYIMPAELVVRPTDAVAVMESLVSQVRSHSDSVVGQGDCPALRLSVDPKALSRCFQLLGVACGKSWQAAAQLRVEALLTRDGERLCISLSGLEDGSPAATAEASLASAVAAQMIEMQGGDLEWSDAGSAAFSLHLPIQGRGNEAL